MKEQIVRVAILYDEWIGHTDEDALMSWMHLRQL
jgi:hypothetical protein